MVSHLTHMTYVETINFNDTMFNEYTAEKNQAMVHSLFTRYLDILDMSGVMSSHNES